MRLYTVYYTSVSCSTCFGWLLHPSSGAHINVITESGTCQTVSATFHYGEEVGNISVNCSTCFGWLLHPSSGALITVITASGTGQTVLANFRYRGEFGTQFQLLPRKRNVRETV
jgi:hypothetical protein